MGKPSISSFQLSATVRKRSCTVQCNKKNPQGVSEPTQKGLIVKTDEHRHNSAGRQITPARTGFPEATRDCPNHDLAAAQNQL